ncbi:MAG: HAD family hydrolase, partial [Verrucomicrobiaceae bacterium]
MIKAVIFDLDNCLAPAREVGGELYRPAFEAIRQANRGHLSEAVLEEAFAEIWKHPLDRVAEKYGFSEEMLTAAWEVFTVMEVSRPMSGYGDLAVLGELPVLRFLVTSGFRRLQESKIAALGLHAVFNAVHIDALDEPDRL